MNTMNLSSNHFNCVNHLVTVCTYCEKSIRVHIDVIGPYCSRFQTVNDFFHCSWIEQEQAPASSLRISYRSNKSTILCISISIWNKCIIEDCMDGIQYGGMNDALRLITASADQFRNTLFAQISASSIH